MRSELIHQHQSRTQRNHWSFFRGEVKCLLSVYPRTNRTSCSTSQILHWTSGWTPGSGSDPTRPGLGQTKAKALLNSSVWVGCEERCCGSVFWLFGLYCVVDTVYVTIKEKQLCARLSNLYNTLHAELTTLTMRNETLLWIVFLFSFFFPLCCCVTAELFTHIKDVSLTICELFSWSVNVELVGILTVDLPVTLQLCGAQCSTEQ